MKAFSFFRHHHVEIEMNEFDLGKHLRLTHGGCKCDVENDAGLYANSKNNDAFIAHL